MIIKVLRRINNNTYFDYINESDIVAYGSLLSDNQLITLKNSGNTILAYSALEKLGKQKIIKEIEDLIRKKFKDEAFRIKLNIIDNLTDGSKSLIVEKDMIRNYKKD